MTPSDSPAEAVGALTQAQMIERELTHIRAMWLGPFRKGIIAGLLERAGRPYDPCPASYGDRAARNWSEGFERGLFGDLRRWDERQEESPTPVQEA